MSERIRPTRRDRATRPDCPTRKTRAGARPGPPHQALAAALLLGLSVACSGGGELEQADRNVLLVVVDTLRADRLGCYGNERGLTPRLDALAAEGLIFESASAHAPWTLPSTASLLTSLYPRQHGAGGRVPNFTALAPEVETLAERFAAAGHRTGLIANVIFLGELFGLTRGFEHTDVQSFEDNERMRPAGATTDAALAWLDRTEPSGDRPFFLLVHYFDPHAVYDPPQPFRRRFAEPRDREGGLKFGTREQMVGLRTGLFDPGPGMVRRAEALYDGEVAYTDAEVGRLIDGLAERGLADSTLVVLTSDHGEEFRDHGGLEHGHSLYSELLHVPLILRVPGAAPARVSAGVGLIDVAPTICGWAGLEPSRQFLGRDLVSMLAGGPAAVDRDVLAHGNFWNAPLTSWRSGADKLIVYPDGAAQLYDWKLDPGEQSDRAGAEAAHLRSLRDALGRAEDALQARGLTAPVEVPAEGLRGLEALGYTDGPVSVEPGPDEPGPNEPGPIEPGPHQPESDGRPPGEQ